MLKSLYLFYACVFYFANAVISASSVTPYPLDKVLSDADAAIIRSLNESFDYSKIPENPKLLLHILKVYFTKYHNEPINAHYEIVNGISRWFLPFRYNTGIYHAIAENNLSLLKFYLEADISLIKYHYNWNNCELIVESLDTTDIDLTGLADARSNLSRERFTPLMLAVFFKRFEHVEAILAANLFRHKLLLTVTNTELKFSARSLARRIKDKDHRLRMLSLLRIDKTKHEFAWIKAFLKDDLDISVKEAVLANCATMVENALLLGNYGNKADVNIIRHAKRNGNKEIVEILTLEGYAS